MLRTARFASGGNLTLKLGVLLALFVFEVLLNGFFLAKGSELGYLGGAAEALTFALFNIGVSFLAGAVVSGPAILEQPDTTIFIDPGLAGTVDRFGNVILERKA